MRQQQLAADKKQSSRPVGIRPRRISGESPAGSFIFTRESRKEIKNDMLLAKVFAYDRSSCIGLLDISFIFDQIWSILISL